MASDKNIKVVGFKGEFRFKEPGTPFTDESYVKDCWSYDADFNYACDKKPASGGDEKDESEDSPEESSDSSSDADTSCT